MEKRILIMGIGNYLMADEGVGVHAAEALLLLNWPANISVLDGGTGGFHLLEYFEQHFRSLSDPTHLAARVPLEVTVHAFAASMLGMMTWWLEQAKQYTPEEISSYFRDLFFNGALASLGQADFLPFAGSTGTPGRPE